MIVISWMHCTGYIVPLYLFLEEGTLVGWVYLHVTSGGRLVAGLAAPQKALQSSVCAGDRAFWKSVSRGVGLCVLPCKLPLVDLHGNMTAVRYWYELLVPWLKPHMDEHALPDRPIFQQDKAPPPTAKLTTTFLQTAGDYEMMSCLGRACLQT